MTDRHSHAIVDISSIYPIDYPNTGNIRSNVTKFVVWNSEAGLVHNYIIDYSYKFALVNHFF